MTLITNLRKYRIYNIALFDLLSAIIICEIIGRKYYNVKYYGGLSAVPIGILIHYLFNIDTTLNYYIGLSNKPIN